MGALPPPHPSVRRCAFRGIQGDKPSCNHELWGGLLCPVHDRVECTAAVLDPFGRPQPCGYRLVDGTEKRCPKCGASVSLPDVLRGQR